MYEHILLPTDGSRLSEEAVEAGVRLAKALGARVTGLHVIVESRVAAGIGKADRPASDHPEAAAAQHLRVVAEAAKRAGVPHEDFHVRAESPHEGIVAAAAARGCDLIFMASHGRRGIAGLLLGSETTQVLSRCKIPVLVHR
jgi:nucleotide-binding universal stress UspA family protein